VFIGSIMKCNNCRSIFKVGELVYRQANVGLCESCAKKQRVRWKCFSTCSECSRVIMQASQQVYVVCGKACSRVRSIRLQKEVRAKKRIKVRKCQVCGVEFEASRIDARYCSPKCRMIHHRQ
jgi:hypothetical protein